MDRKQRIDMIVAMLAELDDKQVKHLEEIIALRISDERYYEIYSEIDEKYKRAEAIDSHVKKFTEMLKREGDD